jgi:YVTN family beta-propeller protein
LKRIFLLLGFFAIASCDSQILFQPLGDHLAAPISLAVDTASLRAYVVNSNNNQQFTGASLSVLDITDPVNPVILNLPANPVPINSFSGQIYFDPVADIAYVPNRFTANTTINSDSLLTIDVDEASANFGTVATYADGQNPFGIACCDANGLLYVVANGGNSSNGLVDAFDPTDLSTSVQISLAGTLSTGASYNGFNSTEAVLLGTQLFVSSQSGFIYVINTAEVGNTVNNPIDYIVYDSVSSTGTYRGIATDGTFIYVVDATGTTAGQSTNPCVRILNPATLTPLAGHSAIPTEIDIATVTNATPAVGNNPNEVIVYNGAVYVTNQQDNTVSVFDASSYATIATITANGQPFGMAAFNLNGTDYLYVTNLIGNSISIIDIDTNTVLNTFSP